MLKLAMVFLIAAVMMSCSSGRTKYLDSPALLDVSGLYTHSPSGMTFPISTGEFKRGTINRYDPQGSHVSVGYDLSRASTTVMAVIVDVYPSAPIRSVDSAPGAVETARITSCQNEFDTTKEEIIVAYPGSNLLVQNDVVLQPQGISVPGNFAMFEYEASFGEVRQPLRSRLVLFCYLEGEWTLKYRFTYASSLNGNQYIDRFMESLQWPIKEAN